MENRLIGVEALYMETWIPDENLVIVYYPLHNLLPENYQVQLDRDCYVMNREQFLSFRVSVPNYAKHALYANRPREPKSKHRVYFHPRLVTEYIDDDIGFRSRLVDDSEKVTQLYPKGTTKLVPLFPLDNY